MNGLKFISRILFFYYLFFSSYETKGQTGKYYGSNYSCWGETSSANQYYWLDLKENGNFEYHSFYSRKNITTCRSMEGKWEVSVDTLKLIKSKRRVSYYLMKGDSIISPGYYSMLYQQKVKIDSKGIDNFGLGVLLFQSLNRLLVEKSGLAKELIMYWTNRKCQ